MGVPDEDDGTRDRCDDCMECGRVGCLGGFGRLGDGVPRALELGDDASESGCVRESP
jgi:hypothetical protein